MAEYEGRIRLTDACFVSPLLSAMAPDAQKASSRLQGL